VLRDHRDHVLLVPPQGHRRRPQELRNLPRHCVEDRARSRALRDQRGHAPERGLLVGEPAQLVATRLEHALSLAELRVGAPALGCVPRNAEHDAALRHRPRVPFEPPHRAVGANDAGLVSDEIMSLPEPRQRLARRLHVVRMSDVEDRPREELGLRITERALERRVHALEVAVEADDAQQVDRKIEELLQLGLGLRHTLLSAHVDSLLTLRAIMA
jgi:hypothetical protein